MADDPPITDRAGSAAHRRRRVGRASRGAASSERGARRGLALGALERTPPPWPPRRVRAVACALLPARRPDNEYSSASASTRSSTCCSALGLNVVVGFAGLLDLGYVAFFGFGAYAYAMLASRSLGHPLAGGGAVPVVIVGGAVLGLILGLAVAAPARRLPRDRDALLPPGVRHVRQQREPRSVPVLDTVDLTGGPNGIADIDPFELFGWTLTTTRRATTTSRSASFRRARRRSSSLDRVAHRPRLARAARGRARRRADEHAR